MCDLGDVSTSPHNDPCLEPGPNPAGKARNGPPEWWNDRNDPWLRSRSKAPWAPAIVVGCLVGIVYRGRRTRKEGTHHGRFSDLCDFRSTFANVIRWKWLTLIAKCRLV